MLYYTEYINTHIYSSYYLISLRQSNLARWKILHNKKRQVSDPLLPPPLHVPDVKLTSTCGNKLGKSMMISPANCGVLWISIWISIYFNACGKGTPKQPLYSSRKFPCLKGTASQKGQLSIISQLQDEMPWGIHLLCSTAKKLCDDSRTSWKAA